MNGDSIRIPVEIPGSARYNVTVGSDLLATLSERVVEAAAGRPYRLFLVTSPPIWELWSKAVLAAFPHDHSPTVLFLPPGEKHKRLAAVESLAEQMAEAGADRDALLLAFGGGVIGDVTGFLAAIYMRGVPFLQVPTTLLAQVDSSVGGKTGVNLRAGKNLVGSFHHPRAVVADVSLLRTLPPRELRAGLQEAAKAAIIADLQFFAYLEQNALLILSGEPSCLAHVVRRSVEIKAEVVVADERESGRRMTLNFGHTLGHAVEASTGYKKLLHGEAVAWGMIAALQLGRSRGSITEAQFAQMEALIFRFGPLPRFHARAPELVARTAADKKNRSGRRAFILPTGIGSTKVVYDVSDEELAEAARSMMRSVRKYGVRL